MAPFLGGAEVAAERLGIGLASAGHDIVILLGQRNIVGERMQAAGLRCLYTPMYLTDKWHWFRYLRARKALRRVLREEQPEIIHSNDLPTHQIVSDAARDLVLPRLCHHRFPFPGRAIDWLNKYGAERHLFVSRALMEEMCGESAGLRAAARSVVYDGLPLPPVPDHGERARARALLGLPAGRTCVIIAGQVIERKGVADLIRAWALLRPDTRGDAELLVVGDDLAGNGAYRAAMEALSGQLGCPTRFVGFQRNVGAWLLAADVAVVPSHVEPLGNATLEAMSYALPVIGSTAGGIPEMVVHGETGLLTPPRDPERLAGALKTLLLDPQSRLRYGTQGRRRCEELFSLAAHVHSVEQEYQHVLRATRALEVS
jgi:glycosyltransferase involved in cell wall biosynthesis